MSLQAQPTLVQMGHGKNLGFLRKSWFPWNTKVGFMVLALFIARVTSEDMVEEEPSSGLLCISECATCPVICSPPPPPLASSYSNHAPPPLPTSHPLSPPLLKSVPPPPPLLTSYPPPPPLLTSYPPPISPLTSNPPPPPLLISHPPPSLTLPPPALLLPPSPPTPPTHSSGAAPPPPLKSNNPPTSGSAQPNVISGPHDYPYPYYYYYASGASYINSVHVIPFLLSLLFLHRVFFCW